MASNVEVLCPRTVYTDLNAFNCKAIEEVSV
jgi:hypothetical protein